MEQRQEKILVKGGDPVDAVSSWTIWGPVIGEGEHHRSLALRWVFDDPAAMNLGLLALETAPDAATAIAPAPDFGMPAQNLVVADRAGAIGWTIAGRLPRRVGYDGRVPAVWAYGDRRWDGYLPPADYPRVLSPASGQIWSANNREVGGADYARLGDGGYMSSARARQIRDDLTALTAPATPRDLLGVQLDDRALFLGRWQQLLLATLTPDAIAAKSGRAELRRLVAQWSGRAATDSVAYYLVRRWRDFVAERALGPIFAPAREVYDRFDFHRLNYEEPLWRLVQDAAAQFPHARLFRLERPAAGRGRRRAALGGPAEPAAGAPHLGDAQHRAHPASVQPFPALVNLQGVFPALTTPFASDSTLALDKLQDESRSLQSPESLRLPLRRFHRRTRLLDYAEVQQVWEATRKAAAPGKILIAGTGVDSTQQTIARTRRAAEIGFDFALVKTPYYFKPQMTAAALEEHFRRVADASPIPILIYAVPQYTGITVTSDLVARLATHPNIVGIKESPATCNWPPKSSATRPPNSAFWSDRAAPSFHRWRWG